MLRLLVADTIEQNVLRLQEQKLMQSGGASGGQARELLVEDCPDPPGAAKRPYCFPQDIFCIALLYGRAGCSTAKNGGFRTGQWCSSSKRHEGRAALQADLTRINTNFSCGYKSEILQYDQQTKFSALSLVVVSCSFSRGCHLPWEFQQRGAERAVFKGLSSCRTDKYQFR